MSDTHNRDWDEWIAGAVILFFVVLGFFLVKGCDNPVATVSQTASEAKTAVVNSLAGRSDHDDAAEKARKAQAEAERLRREAEARAKAAAAESDALLNAFGKKIGDFFDHTLPDGASIKIPQGGMESELLEKLKTWGSGLAAGAGLAAGTATDAAAGDASNDAANNAGQSDEAAFNFDRIYFATGSAALNAESSDQINSVAAILDAYPTVRVHLRGHTDSVGSDADNQVLSEARAASVKTALASVGINSARISTEGLGESQPADTNATKEGRRNNRRIEFSLLRYNP